MNVECGVSVRHCNKCHYVISYLLSVIGEEARAWKTMIQPQRTQRAQRQRIPLCSLHSMRFLFCSPYRILTNAPTRRHTL